MKKLFAVVLTLATLTAGAYPEPKGLIVSSGTSTNNRSTGSPFTLTASPISIQCDADVYLRVGADSSTAASATTDLKLAAGTEQVMLLQPSRTVVAVLPVSGAATCKVFLLIGETPLYAKRSGGGGSSQVPCGDTDTCAALSYTSTQTDGTAGFIATGYGQILRGPGGCTGIAVDPDTGYTHAGCLSGNSIWMWGDGTLIQSGQARIINGSIGLDGTTFITNNFGGVIPFSNAAGVTFNGGTALVRRLLQIVSLDFGSIGNGATATLTATVTGAMPGDSVTVTRCPGLESDIGDLQTWASTTDTVTLQVRNYNLVSPVNPASCDFTFQVMK